MTDSIRGRGLASIAKRDATQPAAQCSATLACGTMLGFEEHALLPRVGQQFPCRRCGDGFCEVVSISRTKPPTRTRPKQLKKPMRPSVLTPEIATALRDYLTEHPGTAYGD